MARWLQQLGAESGFRKRDSWILSATIVCLLAACTFLVGIAAVPVTDRDEPRFAQASRQMAESDRLADWVIPRVGDEIRLKKPPLIYWVQAPTVLALTGGEPRDDAIWMYRLPSAVAALAAALCTLWLGRRMLGGNTGLLAACLIVVAPVVVTDSHMARADQLLLLTTTLSMCALWALWSTHRRDPSARGGLPLGTAVLFWAFVGLGILAKGPITPFVAGTCALGCAAARRDWRFLWRLRPVTGLVVLMALAAPWILLAVREVGWDTLKAAFDREVLQRAREGAEGHGAPPGYYLVTVFAFFFPGSLLVVLGFERMVKRAFSVRHTPSVGFAARMKARFASVRGRDAELFLFFWIVPTWLAFELIVTKFPHYVLPLYPALALMGARLALGGLRALPTPVTAGDRVAIGAWMVVGCALSAAGAGLWIWLAATGRTADARPSWPALGETSLIAIALASLATLLALLMIVQSWRYALATRFAAAVILAVPATALAEMALFGAWIPSMRWIWNTPRIVGVVADASGKTPRDTDFPRIGGVGYGEDSLLWTTRDRLDRLGEKVTDATRPRILAWCAENKGAYLVVPRANAQEFLPLGMQVGELRGFNYSDGDPVDHAVIHIAR
ncbi:MAG: ArnT family glycosyltransferase [Phycisphaerales bacterium]